MYIFSKFFFFSRKTYLMLHAYESHIKYTKKWVFRIFAEFFKDDISSQFFNFVCLFGFLFFFFCSKCYIATFYLRLLKSESRTWRYKSLIWLAWHNSDARSSLKVLFRHLRFNVITNPILYLVDGSVVYRILLHQI